MPLPTTAVLTAASRRAFLDIGVCSEYALLWRGVDCEPLGPGKRCTCAGAARVHRISRGDDAPDTTPRRTASQGAEMAK